MWKQTIKKETIREMSNKRRNSNSLCTSAKQHQITKFVEKNSDLMRGIAKVTSTESAQREHCTKVATVVAKHSVNNKRARPDTISSEGNIQGQTAKKQITNMPGETSEHECEDNKGVNPLNPELMELKRQLFEGFDT